MITFINDGGLVIKGVYEATWFIQWTRIHGCQRILSSFEYLITNNNMEIVGIWNIIGIL